VCKLYFGVPDTLEAIIDDARHYIKTVDKNYDIIIYDTFLSESVPEHLLTKEGIGDALNKLKPGGMIMSNFYGFTEGDSGYAARSVFKTFEANGLHTQILATPGGEASRNLIFLASEKPADFTQVEFHEKGRDTLKHIDRYFLDRFSLDIQDAEVLIDEKPKLSKLYAKAASSWKESYNQTSFNFGLDNWLMSSVLKFSLMKSRF